MAALDPVLFLILARGGSRRVPGKNLRLVAGIPLVGRAARVAQRAASGLEGENHAVVCSTDDPAIAAAAQAWGAEIPFERPAGLASDSATSVAAAIHALDALESDGRRFRALVLVQPTSPLTDAADLRSAVELFDRSGGSSVVSVTATHPVSWHTIVAADGQITGNATGPAATERLSGAFYVVAPATLRRTGAFFTPGAALAQSVPPERSVDVDHEVDLVIAEAFARATPTRAFQIGGQTIGAGRPFVIAEAGVNHNGSVELAHRLIDVAADCGADAVKFQTFDARALAAPDSPTAEYQVKTTGNTDQRQMLARLALPPAAWRALQAHAHDRNIEFLSSPFDDASADLLFELEVPAIKVPSGELTNLPFLKRLAAYGRPMLVSTGMADMVEVAQAVDAIAGSGDPPIALLHCVSSYPTDAGDTNLRAIDTLRAAFGRPSGWSDHTLGIEVCVAAVARGAALIEKHLTLDRSMAGPDHRASLEPDAFREMVADIRTVERSLGSGIKVPTVDELKVAAVARKSLHWGRPVAAGTIVVDDDVVAQRPGTGLAPGMRGLVLGRRTSRDVAAGASVVMDDLDPST